MAAGTTDLQRDLNGAIMQSISGALLTAGYASIAAGPVQAGTGTRTRDPLFTRQALYQLSYSGTAARDAGTESNCNGAGGAGYRNVWTQAISST